MSADNNVRVVSEDRVRNVREWNAARAGQLSGASTTVDICDELLALRAEVERLKKTVADMRAAEREREREFSRELRDAVAEAEHNARNEGRDYGY